MNNELTQKRLKEVFDYDPETGVFTRKMSVCNRVKVGDVICRTNDKGYYVLRIDGPLYLVHRLAWMYMTGAMPANFIDHINGVRTDNRIANLREATRSENAWNHRTRTKKAPLPMGLREMPSGRIQARIQFNKKALHLGTFETVEQAQREYIAKRKELFGSFCPL